MKRKISFPRYKKSKQVMRGSRLAYNAAQQAKYVRALQSLTQQMTADTKSAIERLFKSGTAKDFYAKQKDIVALDESISSLAKKTLEKLVAKWREVFRQRAGEMAKTMVNGAMSASKSSLKRSLSTLSGGLSIKTDFISAGLGEVLKAVVVENVALIKSIPEEYLNDVTGIVMRSITTGAGVNDLIPALNSLLTEKAKRITNKAKNLALDQTRKVYNGINRQRMMSVGVRKFEWVHSGGGQHPRQRHIDMSGNIYRFDDPPVIDDKGTRGFPGDAPNCGCTMIPVVEFDEEEE